MDLSDKSMTENDFQKNLESGMSDFYPFWVLNHGIHLDMVLSKWHIHDNLETDMTYITKSSDEWWIVFVEFEPPGISLTTKSNQISADLGKGIKQINDWRIHVEKDPRAVRDRLDRFMMPENRSFNENKFQFKYLLVAGREDELNDQRKKDQVRAACQEGMYIKTWDSMIRNAERYREGINVCSIQNEYAVLKNMNTTPPMMWMNPHDFKFNDEQISQLRTDGHCVDEWLNGERLCWVRGSYITHSRAKDTMRNTK